MSCSCNCTPCNCQPRPSICCTPTVESITYTFENANLSGIGVFDNETDQLVQFRGIVSDSVALTVTLDAVNNTIVLDFDDAALVAAIPDATTTQRGILETATNAEALAKAAADKILTPSNLAALGSTTSFAGMVELATDAETIAGVSSTLAVTPAGLLAATSLYRTTTFVDGVARGAAVPEFQGQFGAQLDVNSAWLANGVGAGDWLQVLTGNTTNTLNSVLTTISFQNGTFTFEGVGGTGTLTVDNMLAVTFFQAPTTFSTSDVTFSNSDVTFNASARIFDSGGVIPADSILLTTSTAGQLSSLGIATFLSESNTEVWVAPAGSFLRTSFTTYTGQTISNPPTQAEVQTLDDAVAAISQRFGALIIDLMATLKPHAT